MMASVPTAQTIAGLAARMRFSTIASALLVGTCAVVASAQDVPQTADAASALARGEAWLADQQHEDGSWWCRLGKKIRDSRLPGPMGMSGGLDSYSRTDDIPHVGVTSLAGLALLRAGGREGAAEKAAAFLAKLSSESPIAYITAHGTRMIEHALAVRFLAELQAKHPQQAVEDAVWRGAGLIVRSQSQEGGWIDQPIARDADMRFTAPPFEALLAARAAGVEVPEATLDAACEFALRCRTEPRDGSFSERDLPAEETRFTFPCTAAGVFVLLAGRGGPGQAQEQADDQRFDAAAERGVRYLLVNRRQLDPGSYRYLFGHYYAVQALKLGAQADREAYGPELQREILALQKPDGSWEDDVGPTYATAVACLILQLLR